MDQLCRKLVMTSKDESIMKFLANESFENRELNSQCNQDIYHIIFLLIKSGYPYYSIKNTLKFNNGALTDYLYKSKPLYGIPIVKTDFFPHSICDICEGRFSLRTYRYVLPSNNSRKYTNTCYECCSISIYASNNSCKYTNTYYECCSKFINASEILLRKLGEQEVYKLYCKLSLFRLTDLFKSCIDRDVFELIFKLIIDL